MTQHKPYPETVEAYKVSDHSRTHYFIIDDNGECHKTICGLKHKVTFDQLPYDKATCHTCQRITKL